VLFLGVVLKSFDPLIPYLVGSFNFCFFGAGLRPTKSSFTPICTPQSIFCFHRLHVQRINYIETLGPAVFVLSLKV
jgi:hypothetical protein